MHALVRSLLIWWMVLAIPNQGLAASFMPHCAPAEPRAATVAVAAAASDRRDRVAAGNHADHDAAHAAHGSAAAASGDADPAQGPAAEHAGSCSVCAACCHAIGMLPGLSPIPEDPGATQAPRPATVDVVSFVPAGLDPPPRSLLA